MVGHHDKRIQPVLSNFLPSPNRVRYSRGNLRFLQPRCALVGSVQFSVHGKEQLIWLEWRGHSCPRACQSLLCGHSCPRVFLILNCCSNFGPPGCGQSPPQPPGNEQRFPFRLPVRQIPLVIGHIQILALPNRLAMGAKERTGRSARATVARTLLSARFSDP